MPCFGNRAGTLKDRHENDRLRTISKTKVQGQRLIGSMAKWINEFRRAWQGVSNPPLLFSTTFAVASLAASSLLRAALTLIRPDMPFTTYFPAVFFSAVLGGLRVGIATTLAGGALGLFVRFGDGPEGSSRIILLVIYLFVCGLTMWVVDHYRSIVLRQQEASKRLAEEEEYRKLIVQELQHRLKNKLSTIHAVLRQVLQDQPAAWANVDRRIRALSATDDLIARVDGSGCDIKDLLTSELGPYGHVRFTLNGEPLFLPAKLAVSLALVFHELATNASKYGAFSSPRGLLQVSWSVSEDRLSIVWDETEGPPVQGIGPSGFGTRLLQSALRPFDGKTEIVYLRTGVHCTMQCRIPSSERAFETRSEQR